MIASTRSRTSLPCDAMSSKKGPKVPAEPGLSPRARMAGIAQNQAVIDAPCEGYGVRMSAVEVIVVSIAAVVVAALLCLLAVAIAVWRTRRSFLAARPTPPAPTQR